MRSNVLEGREDPTAAVNDVDVFSLSRPWALFELHDHCFKTPFAARSSSRGHMRATEIAPSTNGSPSGDEIAEDHASAMSAPQTPEGYNIPNWEEGTRPVGQGEASIFGAHIFNPGKKSTCMLLILLCYEGSSVVYSLVARYTQSEIPMHRALFVILSDEGTRFHHPNREKWS